MPIIAPSILASDFGKLNEEIELINRSEADWIHVDIMDGVFVPNISFGMPVLKSVSKVATKPLDVHLMIVNPDQYIEKFVELGAELITVHYEACPHLHRTIQHIKEAGAKAGVALNPHTNVDLLDDVLEDLDLVLVMSVNPGFGGQKFIRRTLEKLHKLKQRIINRNLHTLLEVDGGVGLHNAEQILHAGADVLVAGSSVFKSEDPEQTIQKFKAINSQYTFSV